MCDSVCFEFSSTLPEAGIFMIFILIFMITSCGALHLHFSSVQRVHD